MSPKRQKLMARKLKVIIVVFILINKMNTVIPDPFLLDFYVQRMFDACSAVYEAFLF